MVIEQLGSLFRVRSGDGISIANLNAFGTYPVYGGNGVNGYTSKYNVENETMVIGRVGEKCGNVNVTQSRSWVSDNALIVTPKAKYDIGYMRYLLEQINLNDYANRNAQPVISGQIIYAIETPYVEDIEEQVIIAHNLRSFDIYIDDLAELIEKKRGIREGALEDLMCQRTRLNDYSREWEEVQLSEICKVYDGTHQTPKYTLQGIRFVSVENILDLYSSNKYISQTAYESDFKAYPEKGDILMTRIGDIGTPCVVDRDEPLAYYVSLALLKNITINSYFLNYYIMSSGFQRELDDRSLHHATPKKINKGEIGKCKVKYPKDADEQAAIANILRSMDEEIEALEIERDKMIQIREGAMDDLLTGRVRLSV